MVIQKMKNENIVFSSLFIHTLNTHKVVADKAESFINAKLENPTQRYGASDSRFIPAGPLGKLKVSHAHLSKDISILYRIAGTPAKLYLYGIFSHKESGTSDTPNINKQKSLSTTLGNQFPIGQYPDLKENEFLGTNEDF